MSKYQRLAEFLRRQSGDTLILSFEDVERVIGSALPDSARKYREWWANQANAGARQCRAWLDVGWAVQSAELTGERVTFRRG